MAIAAEHADIGMVKVLAVLMPGCAIPVVGCGTGSDGNGLDVQRNLDVAGLTVTDVFALSHGKFSERRRDGRHCRT
jgi:hypothetical protein